MNIRQMRGKLAHIIIAVTAVMIIGMLVTWLEPGDMGMFEIVLFVVVSQLGLYLRVSSHKWLNGYGVARRINRLAGVSVIDDFGGIVWGGLAVRPLVRSWSGGLGLCLGAAVVAAVLERYSLDRIALLFWVYASARLLALVGEVYVWLMASRHFHWYLHEYHLRGVLRILHWPDSTAEELVRLAAQEGLVLIAPGREPR